MSLPRIIGGFLGLWVLFYIGAYFFYMAPAPAYDPNQNNAANSVNRKISIADTPFAAQGANYKGHKYVLSDVSQPLMAVNAYVPSLTSNPFVSPTCEFMTSHAREMSKESGLGSVAVIIPARNENILELAKTVESIIKNSGDELHKILIIDDFSTVPIELWNGWSPYQEAAESKFGGGSSSGKLITSSKSVLQIARTEHRKGVSGAKSYGEAVVRMFGLTDILVFVDAHVIVSNNWLVPLIKALQKQPEAIVYPAIDVIDGDTGDLIKGDSAVGAFDWAMNFRWETIDPRKPEKFAFARKRVPLSTTDEHGHVVNDDDMVTSPAAPGIFAITSKYYNDIGGLATFLYPWGQESVELSIRVWLCGGMVIRQPCSRVAHKYTNLFNPSIVGNGVSEEQVDKNVLTVAELWMSKAQRETAFQARFTGRVPYTVELSLDARHPQQFMHVKMLTSESCQPFDWFLAEVYPGLALDREGVEIAYRNHLASDYFKLSLGPLIDQYSKKSEVVIDETEVELLEKRGNKQLELDLKQSRMRFIPKAVEPPKPLSAQEVHDNNVRDTNECIDRPVIEGFDYCKVMATPDSCEKNKADMMFRCPKSCGWCGSDGLTCFDYYEKKCPIWAAAGNCDTNEQGDMKSICRVSCKFCSLSKQTSEPTATPTTVPTAPVAVAVAVAAVVESKPLENHNVPPPDPAAAVVAVVPLAPPQLPPQDTETETFKYIDPYVAQKQFAQGLLPDPPFTSGTCDLNGTPNGNILAHMDLYPAPRSENNPPKILCGVYTMEKNHKTEVQATRETWGKRCTGFIAFSTVTDESIPALKILHEGVESYDNMWQKSRSIWKYLYKNFLDKFDYFLMGGDDMYYVVDNLQHYLMSDEIVKLKESGKGMFLGRRFYPDGLVNDRVFNSGGAGYIMDRAALSKLGPALDTPACFPHQVGFWEDVNIANCLKVTANIIPYDTRDKQERERFHPFTPGQHLEYRIPKTGNDWYPKYNPWLKEGYDCCSTESISFHYCKQDIIRKLHTYLYHCTDKKKPKV